MEILSVFYLFFVTYRPVLLGQIRKPINKKKFHLTSEHIKKVKNLSHTVQRDITTLKQ